MHAVGARMKSGLRDTQPFWRLSDREAAFAFMAYCVKNGIPYRKDETLLSIGGLQDRGEAQS